MRVSAWLRQSGRRVSNPRPLAWEANALPTELRPPGPILIGLGTGRHTSFGTRLVQAHGGSNEGRKSLLIDFIVLAEVDCPPGVAFEA
jgi:hypothetical protein